MAFDSQEEEQIEAIKKWWQENGNAVIMGVSLGLALLLGWKFWQNYQHKQAEEASMMYEHLMLQVKNKDNEKALQAGQLLLSKHPDSLYATLTSLMLAKENLSPDNSISSEAHLQWVIDNDPQSEWAHLARLRKARLLLAREKFDEALALIPATYPESFKGAFARLTGDIHWAKGDIEPAKQAYDQALAQVDFGGVERDVVQMQRDNLGKEQAGVFNALKPSVSIKTADAIAHAHTVADNPLSIETNPINLRTAP